MRARQREAGKKMIPGEYFLKTEPIQANNGRVTSRIVVTNRGDRPIQVGSHCHFFEVNRALDFNRDVAYGMRLNIPAGTGSGSSLAMRRKSNWWRWPERERFTASMAS